MNQRYGKLANLCWGVAATLAAQVAAAATPTAFFDSATVVGTQNRINVARLPVMDANGAVVYRDVVLDFTVSNTGVVSSLPPVITTSPTLISNGFLPGLYKDTNGNKYQVSGPAVIPDTTRTSWNLSLLSSPAGTISGLNMTWVTGPVAGHPNQVTLTTAGITTTPFTWGIVGQNSWFNLSSPFYRTYNWGAGYIIGAEQVGNNLVLHYFLNTKTDFMNVVLTRCTAAC